MVSGLILLDKPSGITSFQALGSLKKTLGHKKIGHTGTLDKFARGLMVVLAGSFTRLNPQFTGLSKTYVGTVRFGEETDTLDPEGEVIASAPVPPAEAVLSAVSRFLGPQLQIPPLYSALHVEGRRAHSLARAGETAELPPREIEIYSLDILDYSPPDLSIRVHCSKGTYIRSLARDLGLACDSRAHLVALVREKVGDFSLVQAVSAENFLPDRDLVTGRDVFTRLPGTGILEIAPEKADRVRNGAPFRQDFLQKAELPGEGLSALFCGGEFLALMETRQGRSTYRFVDGSSR